MKDDFIYLTYYQAMIFLLKINELKNNNQYFNDNLANSFGEFVLQRTYEIATTTPSIKAKLFPNSTKYKISKSLFNYLTSLTSIDVFDKETLGTYTIIINEFEKEIAHELINTNKSKSKKIHKF